MKTQTLLMERLEETVRDFVGPLVTQALLPGVDVRISNYQRERHNAGDMVAVTILLDPTLYPDWDALPHDGNRPLTDNSSGRWWYDKTFSVGDRSHQYPTREAARGAANEFTASVLKEIASTHLLRHLTEMAAGL